MIFKNGCQLLVHRCVGGSSAVINFSRVLGLWRVRCVSVVIRCYLVRENRAILRVWVIVVDFDHVSGLYWACLPFLACHDVTEWTAGESSNWLNACLFFCLFRCFGLMYAHLRPWGLRRSSWGGRAGGGTDLKISVACWQTAQLLGNSEQSG